MTVIEKDFGERCWCGGETYRPQYVGGKLGEPGCSESKFHDPFKVPQADPVIRKLYVSGPMTGLPQCNYPAFNEAAQLLREEGLEVVNPAELGDKGSSYHDLLREDIRQILDCDGIATLEGWWGSVGAKLEVNIAGHLGMPVRTVSEWLALASATMEEEAS